MKKVDDLKGRELDAWTYKALGYGIERHEDAKDRRHSNWFYTDKDYYARMPSQSGEKYCVNTHSRSPSDQWAYMGQLMREFPINMFMEKDDDGWLVMVDYNSVIAVATANHPDPTSAFCKALIKTVFGDEVDEQTLFSGPVAEWRRNKSFQSAP